MILQNVMTGEEFGATIGASARGIELTIDGQPEPEPHCSGPMLTAMWVSGSDAEYHMLVESPYPVIGVHGRPGSYKVIDYRAPTTGAE